MAIAFYYGGGGVQEMSKPTSICNVEKLFLEMIQFYGDINENLNPQLLLLFYLKHKIYIFPPNGKLHTF